jgi:hypothetical protein
MSGLTTELLGRACRIFLALAYPQGEETIPAARRAMLHLPADQPLEALLVPPLAQTLATPQGARRGYALRLGSATFPHLKLQVTLREDAACVFSVDTHDAIRLDPGHPDAAAWGQLQAANRRLKEQIECAWEADGLQTFNSLLRRELDKH